MNVEIVMPTLAALRGRFHAIWKKPQGVRYTPPPSMRGLKRGRCDAACPTRVIHLSLLAFERAYTSCHFFQPVLVCGTFAYLEELFVFLMSIACMLALQRYLQEFLPNNISSRAMLVAAFLLISIATPAY